MRKPALLTAAIACLISNASYAECKDEVLASLDKQRKSQAFRMETNMISEQGPVTFWRYFGTEMVEHRFWSYRSYVYGHRVISEPYLDFDYYPRSYESAEVSFAHGLVQNWRKMDGQNR